MFEKINNLIKYNVNKSGFQKQSTAARICFEANSLYGHLFKAKSYLKGTLKVSVKNNIEANEIRFKIQNIIKDINSKLGSSAIKKIIFEIG